MKILSFLSRFAIIAVICLSSQPARAQSTPADPPGAECPAQYVKNEFSPAVATAPQASRAPIEPLEILFESSYTMATAVQGLVSPNTEVTMQVYVLNALSWTVKTTSDASGYYRLSAYRPAECSNQQPGKILEGNRVEISVGGQTYATVAHSMTSVAVDPMTKTVSGSVTAGLLVEVRLEEPLPGAPCDAQTRHMVTASAAAQSNNKFKAVLEDFGARAVATLRIHDGTGSSFMLQNARQMTLNLDRGYLSGVMDVNATVTFTITRGGQVIETASAFISNYLSHQFTAPLQPGDLIEARAASGLLYQAVVSPLNGTIDVQNNRITGQADPSRPVYTAPQMYFKSEYRSNHCWDSQLPTLCALAGLDGSYSIPAPLDLRAGDTVHTDPI